MKVQMTKRGYEQAAERLRKLKEVELPRLEKALGDARELGDLSENSEFETARQEIWVVEQQIGELTQKLSDVEIIPDSQILKDRVDFGALVSVLDLDRRAKDQFMIVSDGETRSDYDTVSTTSPLGQAILGRKVNEEVEFAAPRGKIRYKITKIEYP
jgi:transcription elongation factor GreA